MANEHIERMIVEHRELTEKIQALNIFIYSSKIFQALDGAEKARMIKQAGFMEEYAQVLDSRIWVGVSNV